MFFFVLFLHEKNLLVSLHPLKAKELVEGLDRDRVPARCRRTEEVEEPENISRFFLDNWKEILTLSSQSKKIECSLKL